MQGTDGIRRNGYVVALAVGLIALFALMMGCGWKATALVLAALALVVIVEHVAAAQQRHARRREPRLEVPPGLNGDRLAR
jgi:membrane protein implicated in regulation of membrane protease activity